MNKSGGKYKDNKICTDAEYSELDSIRKFVYEKAVHYGFSDYVSSQITLAVDEACTNLIRHNFSPQADHKICIEVEFGKRSFIIKILDKGEVFNPLEVTEPDMNEYFENYSKGGLGIQIMRLVMDEIKYMPSIKPDNRNILQLIKYLPS